MTIEIPDIGMELTGSDPVVETPTPETPPVEEKKEEIPADPTPETPKIEAELFDLPDGRKVDAAGLKREYENLLPEFTKRSQELADFKREKELNKSPDNEPEWKKPDYVPKDYAEVITLAKEAALKEIQETALAEEKRVKTIQDSVDSEITELKKVDPKLDENALFTHANKYGFRDLKTAHANMTDMQKVVVETEQRTVKNLKNREEDQISGKPGGEIPDDSGYDPKSMSQFDSAAEYMASLKGKK